MFFGRPEGGYYQKQAHVAWRGAAGSQGPVAGEYVKRVRRRHCFRTIAGCALHEKHQFGARKLAPPLDVVVFPAPCSHAPPLTPLFPSTFDIQWGDAMGELLELLEAESAAPEDLAEYSCLYIKYLQVRVNVRASSSPQNVARRVEAVTDRLCLPSPANRRCESCPNAMTSWCILRSVLP